MKIINNTTGPIHWNTSFPGGGDCGDIPVGGPPTNYPITPGVPTSISIRVQSISYDGLDNDSMVVVSSRLEEGQAKRASR